MDFVILLGNIKHSQPILVCIQSTDTPLLDWIVSEFGGTEFGETNSGKVFFSTKYAGATIAL